MSDTTTGRLLVFDGPDQPLQLQERCLPQLAEGELLVRITCCTVCGSDLHTYEGRRTTPCPTVLGHEILGRVVQLPPGPPVCDFQGHVLQLGDRVTWSVAVHCGQCFFCLHGLPQKCVKLLKYGHQAITEDHAFNGGLADYCHLKRGTAVFQVPEVLPDVVACPANCATATCAAAIRYAGDCTDAVVLVQGAGMLGLTAAAMSASAGAREIIVCDTQPDRLKVASHFGATRTALVGDNLDLLDATIREVTDGRGIDVAFDMTGAPTAMEAGIDLLRIGGRYVWVGAVFPARPLAIPAEIIVRKLLNIQGVYNYTPDDLRMALEFLVQTQDSYPFAELVSEEALLLEDAEAIFRRAIESDALRVAVKPTASQ